MNKFLGSLIIQFREFYKNLGPTKRISVVAVTLIALIVTLVISMMVGGKDYAPLLSNVPDDQLQVILENLKAKNISFRIGEDGKTILVPKEFLASTQMALMSELGNDRIGQVGLEIFDKQDFGASSFTQKINYQRALQGELMRAINTLSAVKQSKVILAMPNKKTFLEEGSEPTASVVLSLQPGKTLSADQVKGIRFLVANAVEGLDSEKVSVVDDRGKILSKQGDSGMSASSDLMDLKQKTEAELEEKIESILSRVVGSTKVIARVEATLNNRTIQATEETVDPEKTAIRSQQTEEEKLDGARTNPAGIPGSRSNLPGAEDSGQVGFKQDVSKELKTINYDVPKTVKNIKEGAGAIERISVAVVVDGLKSVTKKDDGTTEEKWMPRSAEELKKYEDLIKSTIGFKADRGDSVKIENIQFAEEDFSEAEKLLTTIERKKLLNALLKWSLLGFSLILFFFIVVRPFIQWITDSFQDSVEDMLPRTIEELEELQSVDNTLPGMASAIPVLEESMDPDKAESELLKDRILNLMKKDEEKAAGAFGLWLVRKDGP